MWIAAAVLAVIAFFFWKSRSGGASVQSIGGGNQDEAQRQANYIQGLSSLTGLAIAKSQTDAQVAAINASVETSRINAGAQVSMANRQADVQENSNLFKEAGSVIIAMLPFML